MANIGIMGGTFDPVHYGHLILAQQAKEILELEKVLFVTAASPPHKAGKTVTSASDRHEMVKLAIMDNKSFEPSDVELRRKGVSYTVLTLEQMAKERPNDRLFLLLGADEAKIYTEWYRPERIADLAQVVVANRPGLEVDDVLSSLPKDLSDKIVSLKIPGVDISSSDIRARVASGKSIKYLVPPSVAHFIGLRGLYREI